MANDYKLLFPVLLDLHTGIEHRFLSFDHETAEVLWRCIGGVHKDSLHTMAHARTIWASLSNDANIIQLPEDDMTEHDARFEIPVDDHGGAKGEPERPAPVRVMRGMNEVTLNAATVAQLLEYAMNELMFGAPVQVAKWQATADNGKLKVTVAPAQEGEA